MEENKETNNTNNNQGENKQEQNDKVSKNYDASINKLVAILGGKEKLLPDTKISKDAVSSVVTELLKEKKEATIKEVKEGLSKLLEQNIALAKATKEKEKELEQLKLSKKKEFVDAANKLFNKIEGLVDLEKSYYEGLKSVNDTNKTN